MKALARFTAAVTAQQGIAAARTLLHALRPVDADGQRASPAGRPGSAALPAGAALTAG